MRIIFDALKSFSHVKGGLFVDFHFPQETPRAANLSCTLILASRQLPPFFTKCKGRNLGGTGRSILLHVKGEN